jgi:hypothetical protein
MNELTMNGSFDVDYIKDLSSLASLHFRFNCWDSSPGLKAVKLCIGAFPYGCDISVETRGINLLPRLLPSLEWRPGVPYFLTIQVQDAAGWIKSQTSDGFIIDLVRIYIFRFLT